MRNEHCIYCGTKFEKGIRSKEHVFPKGLLQKGVKKYTLTKTICVGCNKGFSNLDEVIAKQSIIGLIHHEFECYFAREDPKFYHDMRYGNPPLRVFGNLLEDGSSPVILEPHWVTNRDNDIENVRRRA